jgi:hypothetical protein
MPRLTTYLLIWLLGLAGCSTAPSSDPDDWYGARIGAPAPAGAKVRPGIVEGTEWAPQTPWEGADGTADASGRLLSVSYSEACCQMMVSDVASGDIPKRYRSEAQMIAEGEAAKNYTIARLGLPTSCEEWGSGQERTQNLEWELSRPGVP